MNTPIGTTHREHWDAVYQTKGADQVSWFQPEPTVSLQLIDAVGVTRTDPILDVGGGACPLVDRMLERGHTDLTVLDVSAHALGLAQQRLGVRAQRVHWEVADLLGWTLARRYAVWHDRAVFHFLTDPADQARYLQMAVGSVRPGGHLIVATFAADGPERCSGLPVARYGPEQLAAQFRPGFTAVATRREHHLTPTGAEQPFTWLLLRRTPYTGL